MLNIFNPRKRIAILVPTRQRPKGFGFMADSVAKTAGNAANVKIFAATTIGDKYAQEYYQFASPTGTPTVYRWNRLADVAYKMGFDYFMLGSDDMEFATPLWDEAVLKIDANKPAVIHLQDSRDKNGTPHPIMTRAYIQERGFFLRPGFLHWHCDSEAVEYAKRFGCFHHLKNYMLKHNKPSDIGTPDDTHLTIREMGWREVDEAFAKHLQKEKSYGR